MFTNIVTQNVSREIGWQALSQYFLSGCVYMLAYQKAFAHNSEVSIFYSQSKNPLSQNILGQFLGIVGMALAKYDLPTKPTKIGMFGLAFWAFASRTLYLPRIVGSTGELLPSELADLAIYLTKSLQSMDFSILLPRNVGKLGNI